MLQYPSFSIHLDSFKSIKKKRVSALIIINPSIIRIFPKLLKLVKISGLIIKLKTATKSIAKLYIRRLSTRLMVAFENDIPSFLIK